MVNYYTLPDGCSLHSSCSTCPFPDCVAPQKDIVKTKTIEKKHDEVLRLHGIGIPVPEIMLRTGYKDRGTVYDILKGRR